MFSLGISVVHFQYFSFKCVCTAKVIEPLVIHYVFSLKIRGSLVIHYGFGNSGGICSTSTSTVLVLYQSYVLGTRTVGDCAVPSGK